MPGYKLHVGIIVENDNRNLNTSLGATDFVWQLTQPVNFHKRSKHKQYFVRLENIRIPISFYNINANFNVFTFDDGGTDFTVTIAQGNYTIDELIVELQTGMNATASLTTYTITYDEKTQKVNIASDGAGGLTTITATNGADVNTLFRVVGFEFLQTIPDGGNADANNVAYTNTAKHLRLVVDNITSNNYYTSIRLSDNSIQTVIQKVMVYIPITETRNEFQFIRNHQGPRIKLPNVSAITELRVRLVDALGNIVNLNGVPFGFEANFYEYNDAPITRLN